MEIHAKGHSVRMVVFSDSFATYPRTSQGGGKFNLAAGKPSPVKKRLFFSRTPQEVRNGARFFSSEMLGGKHPTRDGAEACQSSRSKSHWGVKVLHMTSR